MKIISKLPDHRHFPYCGKKGKWYIWQEKTTGRVKIYSTIPNPFESEMCILISLQNKKSDESIYPYGLIFKCFPLDSQNRNTPRMQLKRDVFKSEIPCSVEPTTRFWSFPIKDNIWLSYSF